MNFDFNKYFAIILILLSALHNAHSAPKTNSNGRGRTLSDNYVGLVDDVKWFFRGVGNFAGTVERMLPNVTTSDIKNSTFADNTRISFLMGLRHILVGVREISTTFEQSFKTDHITQLQQIKTATNYVNDVIDAMKMWFAQIRALIMHLIHLYNRYIPEVLFGKCLGSYLITTYPDRSYYEYPFLFLFELYSSILDTVEYSLSTSAVADNSTETLNKIRIIDDDLNMEQNEISHTDDSEDFSDKKWGETSAAYSLSSRNNSSQKESFIDFSSVVGTDKNKIINNAIKQKSWQICLKLYTAESISRSFKNFFLN